MPRFAAMLATLLACTSPKPRPTVFGGDRPVTLEIPAPFDEHKSYPLVVVLHGYAATGFLQERYFGAQLLPPAGEAFVVAPDGTVDSMGHQFWNADPACCDFDHTGVDDSGYLGKLIDDISAAWPVAPGVLVMGHSNGGYMAYRLACDRADVVSNIVVLAGAAASDPSTCRPSLPVGVLHLHGTADPDVPYSNAMASVAQWAPHDGCGPAIVAGPDIDLDQSIVGPETHTQHYDPCDVADELWTIQGAGHIPALDPPSFSALVFQYFQAHHIRVPD